MMRLTQRHEVALVEPKVWAVAKLLNMVRLGRRCHDARAFSQAIDAQWMPPQISEPEHAPPVIVSALVRRPARWLRLVPFAVAAIDKLSAS
jgi:hypothetical protein